MHTSLKICISYKRFRRSIGWVGELLRTTAKNVKEQFFSSHQGGRGCSSQEFVHLRLIFLIKKIYLKIDYSFKKSSNCEWSWNVFKNPFNHLYGFPISFTEVLITKFGYCPSMRIYIINWNTFSIYNNLKNCKQLTKINLNDIYEGKQPK